MAYTVNPTNPLGANNPITVDDGITNTQTSLKLPGRNTTSYGTDIAENFYHLLENFASPTAPSNPVEGQLWYDTTVNVDQLKIYDGTQFVSAGGLRKSATQPSVGNVIGDLWVNTDSQQLYLFTGAGWILVGPEFSLGLNTGSKPFTITGTDNQAYTVVLIEVMAKPVAIISTKTFTPKSNITGFSTIQPGFNLSAANIEGSGVGKYYGTSQKAEALIAANSEVVTGSNFLRKDKANIADFSMKINNNAGLDVGNTANVNLGIENQTAVLSHKTSGASIDLRVNDQGSTRTAIRIDSNTNVGINNTAPTETLDVTGNIKASGSVVINSTTDSINLSTGALKIAGGAAISKKLSVGDAATFQAGIISRDIVPSSDSTYNIGSNLNRYSNIYADSIDVTNINAVTITPVGGNINGVATAANKLVALTTFAVDGDVEASSFTFDGSTGGTLKTFNILVKNSFISTKPVKNISEGTDEFLFNRVAGDVGIYKISRNNLFAAVPSIPTGMITPFGGTVSPTFWLLCDGAEYDRTTYQLLFNVIGTNFGVPSSVSKFKVPDFRGRFALGADNMGGTGANRVTDAGADTVGGFGGTENKLIPIQNLPEHEHDLKGPGGAQYYALRDVPGIGAGEITAVVHNAPTGAGQGSALPTSGGINNGTVGQPQDVLNPFTTVNYIIYTGETA
jgi:microcystin-dependent protein/ribosomal protein L27